MRIRTISDMKSFFRKEVKEQVIGVGVTAFNRTGPENFDSNYEIFSLKSTGDDALIRRRLRLNVLEELEEVDFEKQKRNSTTLIKSNSFQKYLKKKDRECAVLLYKPSFSIEKIAKKTNFRMISNEIRLGKKWLENKIKFREVLEKCQIDEIPGFVEKFSEIEFQKTKRQYGSFVIQLPESSGGKGTFFIHSQEDFDDLSKKMNRNGQQDMAVTVSKFIKGPSPSITGCVNRDSVLHAGMQFQILDADMLHSSSVGSGMFCGHEWSGLKFEKDTRHQAETILLKFGKFLRKSGYKGIFGVDLILDTSSHKLYPIEINPRLLGSFPVLNDIQLQKEQIPLLAFHILEFLGKDYQIDEVEYNSKSWEEVEGAQLVFQNPDPRIARLKNEISSGVYTANGDYERPGYCLHDLKGANEIALVDNVTSSIKAFQSNQRFFRLILKKRVLADDNKTLNKEAQSIVKTFFNKLELDYGK